MKNVFLLFFAAAVIFPPPGAAGEGGRAWGSQVSQRYDIWGCISGYGRDGVDEETWKDLAPEKQDKAVAEAEAACRKADAKLGATRNQTDGKAILAVSESDLEYLGVCLKDGEAVAAGLKEKRAKLAEIKRKADQKLYDEADMLWLKANGINMEYQPPADPAAAQLQADREKLQKKTSAAAKKKYGKMKDADAAARAFDNGGPKKAGGDVPGVAMSEKRLKGAQPLKLEARDPKKKLTASAPPEMAGAQAPAAAAPKLRGVPAKAAASELSYYDYKLSKIADSKALSAAQERAQEEKKKREAEVGVAIATREEHEKITKAMINHSIIGGAIPVVYDFIPGGVAADCISGKCTDGSGAWGKAVQLVTGTKPAREVGGGHYTKTEIACAGLADLAGDLDALTAGLTKWIPLPSACNRKNGAK
jgi:hypothetical protein